jgi:chemotaxis protein methyltransferase CheR
MMLDEISTNETEFFREPAHFGYLTDEVLPSLVRRGTRRLRIWSAGCSSGEEAYSLAITLCESLSDLAQWDAKILATDLSTRAIARARRGIYDEQCLGGVPVEARRIYFRRADVKGGTAFRIAEPVRRLVDFARHNLMGDWPMSGPFDAIFCRNVMIYFDKPTRESLVNRFWELLAPGGVLFIGYSESLSGLKHRFRYDQPAVYERSQ